MLEISETGIYFGGFEDSLFKERIWLPHTSFSGRLENSESFSHSCSLLYTALPSFLFLDRWTHSTSLKSVRTLYMSVPWCLKTVLVTQCLFLRHTAIVFILVLALLNCCRLNTHVVSFTWFQLPAVNRGPKLINGKFQKHTIHML